jgi:phosphoglucosamine mutase
MLRDIPDYPQSRTSYPCHTKVRNEAMGLIQKALHEERDAKEVWTYDGVRVNYGDGSWILVRPSGTEPKIRVYAEARTQARLDELVNRATSLIAELTRMR